MNNIIIGALLSASGSDVLANTRLQTMPSNGLLIVEAQAASNTASANFTQTLELPDGDTPMNAVRVPAGATAGALDTEHKQIATFRVGIGGHVTLSFAITGTNTLAYRVTFKPFR